MPRLKLHEAMVEVLSRHGGGWMSRDDIAAEIAADRLYVRPGDGQPPPSDQLRLRARSPSYAVIFECSDAACTRIRLKQATHLQTATISGLTPARSSDDADVPATTARARRAAAAQKYRPTHIRLMLIAEAPPAAIDRYFYFEDVGTHDSLFRYTVRAVLGREPERASKPADLAELCSCGVFLIDLKLDPVDGSPLAERVPSLIERVQTLDPDAVILVKASVFDAAFVAMRDASLPVIEVRIPFPGSGQQRRYLTAMASALQQAGWSAAKPKGSP